MRGVDNRGLSRGVWSWGWTRPRSGLVYSWTIASNLSFCAWKQPGMENRMARLPYPDVYDIIICFPMCNHLNVVLLS